MKYMVLLCRVTQGAPFETFFVKDPTSTVMYSNNGYTTEKSQAWTGSALGAQRIRRRLTKIYITRSDQRITRSDQRWAVEVVEKDGVEDKILELETLFEMGV